MKKMYTTLLCCSLLAGIAKAQNAAIGFAAGTTLSNAKSKIDDETSSSKNKIGFTVGIVSDISIGRNISFHPAIHFTQKGGMEKEAIDGVDYKYTINLNYLEVPLNILFKTNSAKGRFYAGGGPSFALGLSGKAKIEWNGEKEDDDIKFGNGDQDDFKPLDLGINLLTGYQFSNGLFVSVNYNMGLSNLFIDGDSNNYFHNRYLGLRVGYMLKGAKKAK